MHLVNDRSDYCMENAAKIREDKNVSVMRWKGEWNEEKGSGGGGGRRGGGISDGGNDVMKAKDRKKGLARGIRWAASWPALRTKGAARIHRSPSDKP